jgi:hypothetical protein
MTDTPTSDRRWLGSIEVDQRQKFISSADKLQEMVGGSILIAKTVYEAWAQLTSFPGIDFVWPVSGVLRFSGSNLAKLAELLWQIKTKLVYEYGLSITISIVEYCEGSLGNALEHAEVESRKLKDEPMGNDGSPFHPLFVPCSIQPELAANIWRPKAKNDEDRRKLVSAQSEERRDQYSETYLNRFVSFKHYHDDGSHTPHSQNDLIFKNSDSYVALVKADADGIGRLLPWLNASNAKEFCLALNDCVQVAFKNAVDEVLKDDKRVKFPIIPVVVAGEDIWALTSRDVALPFALQLAKQFADLAAEDTVLKTAVSGAKLTLSVSVVFSKQGFPMVARLDLAEELLHNAKAYRRHLEEQGSPEGCLDYFWLQSSSRHSIEHARRVIADGPEEFSLHTRPWSLDEAEKHINAAIKLAGVPRRKLKQLDQLLRRGRLAELAYGQWLKSLSNVDLTNLQSALSIINWELEKPWRYSARRHIRETALLELVELAEILGSTRDEADLSSDLEDRQNSTIGNVRLKGESSG